LPDLLFSSLIFAGAAGLAFAEKHVKVHATGYLDAEK